MSKTWSPGRPTSLRLSARRRRPIGSIRLGSFDPARVIAVGFSNGANMAASTMLLHPETLAGAILIRAQTIFAPEPLPDLTGKRVLLLSGATDPIVPLQDATRLRDLLVSCGAEVDHRIHATGHGLSQADVLAAREWLGAQ